MRLLAKLLVAIISLIVALAIVEGAVRGLNLFSDSRQAAAMDPEVQLDQDDEEALTKRVLHPFLGWVHRPFDGKHNAFGLPSDIADYRTLSEDDLVIGITGGSFALGVAKHGAPAIVEHIETRRPDLEGKVQVIPLALGGYKQPQQLFLIAEMLLLDVPIDAVINIDGFNEIALGYNDARRGYFPFFPAHHFWMQTVGFASRDLTRGEILSTARALEYRQTAAGIRQWLANDTSFNRSELVRAASGLLIRRAEAAAVAAEEEIQLGSKRGLPAAVAALPPPDSDAPDNSTDLITDIWFESSVLLDALCRRADIPYLHFLQPNQYVAGSKRLTREERSRAYTPTLKWSRAISGEYSALMTQGAGLHQQGVEFHDLTMIFQHNSETLYVDDCCHLNERGYKIIGRAVADRLLDRMPEPN